jgi:hypothetical protein
VELNGSPKASGGATAGQAGYQRDTRKSCHSPELSYEMYLLHVYGLCHALCAFHDVKSPLRNTDPFAVIEGLELT